MASNGPTAEVWSAINAYAKALSQLAAVRVAGHGIDSGELQELRDTKDAVDRELDRLMKERLDGQ